MKKVAGYSVDVLEERQDKVMENLQVNKSESVVFEQRFAIVTILSE